MKKTLNSDNIIVGSMIIGLILFLGYVYLDIHNSNIADAIESKKLAKVYQDYSDKCKKLNGYVSVNGCIKKDVFIDVK